MEHVLQRQRDSASDWQGCEVTPCPFSSLLCRVIVETPQPLRSDAFLLPCLRAPESWKKCLSLPRRLYPDMAFFQRPTDYPCQLILDPQNDYETLRRRVEQTTLKAQTVNRNRSGVTNVRSCRTVWGVCCVVPYSFSLFSIRVRFSVFNNLQATSELLPSVFTPLDGDRRIIWI